MINRYWMHAPIGFLLLEEDEAGLCGVRRTERKPEDAWDETPLLLEAKRQIERYFCGSLNAFDLPLSMHGTEFEKAVWAVLRRIPYGETRSYGQIASLLGKPKGSRAVGGACGRNPLLLVVPCHRVIAGTGMLTGFAAGMDAKRALLELEGHCLSGDRLIR